MTRFFTRTHDFLVKQKMIATMVALLLCAGAVMLALRVSYQEDISKFLPQSTQSAVYSDLYKDIMHQNRIAILFHPTDTASDDNHDILSDAMDKLCENLNEHAQVYGIEVQGQFDDSQVDNVLEFVTEHYPLFLSDDDYERIDSMLSSPTLIEDQLEEDKRLLQLPSGGMLTSTLSKDPLHLFAPVIKRLESFQLTSKFTMSDNHIFEESGRFGMVYVTTSDAASESRNNDRLVDYLEQEMHKVESKNVKVTMIGAPVISVSNARQIKRDSLIAMAIAATLILLLLFLHYRRLSEIWWIIISISFGWLMALAGLALFHDEVSMIVLGMGSVIIGIAVNYPLHYLDHLLDVKSRRQALIEMTVPLLIGNITTVSAFLCLVFLDAEALRNLGLFGSLILVGTILFVLVFLPLYASKSRKQTTGLKLSLNMPQLNSRGKRRWFIISMCVITVVLFIFSFKTSFDSNIQHINYMTSEQRDDLERISTSVDQAQIYAVAQGNNLDEALKANETLQSKISSLQSQDKMTTHGVSNFLPTAERQQERITKWKQFWKVRSSQLVDALKVKAASQGFSAEAFEPFYSLIGTEPQVCSDSDFEPLLSILNNSFVINMNGKVNIVTFISAKDSQQEDKIKNTLRKKVPGCPIFSSKDIGNELVSMLSDNFNYIGFVCGFVVFIFLLLSFGRIELCFVSFLPLAVGWIWILGLMYLLGVQFNIVNIILATFIFGQGDDYSIFITEGLIYENAYGKKRLHEYSNSVLLSAIIMFVGIGSLIIAKHPALKSLAIVTFIGMFTVVVMAYYLPPLTFKWLTTLHGEPRKMPVTLKSFSYSLFSILYFVIMSSLVLQPYTWLYFKIKGWNDKSKENYHKLLMSISRFVVNHTPGVKVNLKNENNENFSKPAVIVCNHQSHLDLMCLMSLTPKIVFFTNEWTWNNPFYGNVIHKAEFMTVTNGYESNIPQLKDLVRRGYTIAVFPEGTRSPESKILRFHKGAFLLAEQLGVDLLPVFLHGAGDALSKKEFMLEKGTITVEVGTRLQHGDNSIGETAREKTKSFHKLFISHYDKMRDNLEDSSYWADFVKKQYLYKGHDVHRRCKRNLRINNNYSAIVDDKSYKKLNSICVLNCGQGEMPMLFAKVNRRCQVYAVTSSQDDYALLSNMNHLPENMHVIYKDEGFDSSSLKCDKTINLEDKP
ncbi:MAG: 1-acyl-sn-glycerol-3-phosphate acyltransferase [Muribaculaceae bacterium]|nr:1-acyl-sn-glycerol-3-phosphate acyltransferase [Muribaculaceae bacterium]